MKKLVLAEKPSVGRDISKVLGCVKKNNSYFEGKDYIVTWALGHLVTLAAPEKYKKEFSEWKLETLPMLPQPFKLEVIGSTSKQYSEVKKLLERKDVSEVVIATDAGREGELVARWILDYARCKKPIKRLWISSVTDKAIKDGFNKLVDGHKYDRLYKAAVSRAQADWIVGINGTRALTCKHNASLSMGRVQTPTLGIIANRDDVIRKFESQTFYEIKSEVNGIKVRRVDAKSGQSRINAKSEAEQLLNKIKNKQAIVKSISETDKKTYAKGLYDLTELQRDANRLYGFSAKETLNVMQQLYEKHKVLTYPRTDSKYITDDVVGTLADRVRVCRSSALKDICTSILRQPIRGNKSFVDNSKVGDHHAIIPTEQQPNYSAFVPKEQKIYNLVVKRFLSVLLPPYEYKEISLEVQVENELFRGKGAVEKNIGWKVVYQSDNNMMDDNYDQSNGKEGPSFNSKDNASGMISKQFLANIEQLKKGKSVSLIGTKIDQGKTNPPGYLSEGDLLHEMEKVGLGTVATRSDVIEKIVSNQYVDKMNSKLRITKTGKQLLELVPYKLRSSDLTAKWEKDLEAIAKGNKSEVVFMQEMVAFTKEIVTEIKKDVHQFKHENVSTESCPDCGQKLLIIHSKFGEKLVCRDRNCGYRKNLSKTTNARCPVCKKKLDLVGSGENQTFVCKCGHKEKLTSFNKRKETSNKQMSKREVSKFLDKSSKKEESFNNPFANLMDDFDKK